MNWLAHLYLSEPSPAFRIGNLLPDLVPIAALASLPAAFQRGIVHHRRIDAFTDSHPVVRRSIQRVPSPFRRFAGILIDVFYDHFLAREWHTFSPIPLADFATEIYASFEHHRADIPAAAYTRLEQIKLGNLLCSYRDLEGIAAALRRIGSRLRRPFDLAASVFIFEREYESFYADFTHFFPELRSHVAPVK